MVVKDLQWRTPTAEEMGTGQHMDMADLKLGQRVYNKNGKLMAIDLNRQVDILNRMDANWPTPDASNHRDGEVLRKDNNLEQGGFHGVSLHHAMTKHGHPAPANPSTDGSRRELWPTPEASQGGRQNGSFSQKSWRKEDGTPRQMSLAQATKQWATPQASDPEHSGPNQRDSSGRPALPAQALQWATPEAKNHVGYQVGQDGKKWPRLGSQAQQWATPMAWDHWMSNNPRKDGRQEQLPNQVTKQWATPNAFCYQPPENTEQWKKRAEYQQSKGVNLHKPIQSQVLHEVEKQWGDRKSTRLNSSHVSESRMPSSA